MWYFTWIVGLGFALLLSIVGALWLEIQDDAEKTGPR